MKSANKNIYLLYVYLFPLSVLRFQACTEVNLCYESNNVTDMFPPMAFTEKDRMQYCLKRWAVVPKPEWFKVQFWGDGKREAEMIPSV